MDVCQKSYEKFHLSNKNEDLATRTQRAESLDVILVNDSSSETDSKLMEPQIIGLNMFKVEQSV